MYAILSNLSTNVGYLVDLVPLHAGNLTWDKSSDEITKSGESDGGDAAQRLLGSDGRSKAHTNYTLLSVYTQIFQA